MFIDFIGVCFDQILNQMAKFRYMFGGHAKTPVVIRTHDGRRDRRRSAAFAVAVRHARGRARPQGACCRRTPTTRRGCSRRRSVTTIQSCSASTRRSTTRPAKCRTSRIRFRLARRTSRGAATHVTVVALSRMVLFANQVADKLAKEGHLRRGHRSAHDLAARHRQHHRERREDRTARRRRRGQPDLQRCFRDRECRCLRSARVSRGSGRQGDGTAHAGAGDAESRGGVSAVARKDRGGDPQGPRQERGARRGLTSGARSSRAARAGCVRRNSGRTLARACPA